MQRERLATRLAFHDGYGVRIDERHIWWGPPLVPPCSSHSLSKVGVVPPRIWLHYHSYVTHPYLSIEPPPHTLSRQLTPLRPCPSISPEGMNPRDASKVQMDGRRHPSLDGHFVWFLCVPPFSLLEQARGCPSKKSRHLALPTLLTPPHFGKRAFMLHMSVTHPCQHTCLISFWLISQCRLNMYYWLCVMSWQWPQRHYKPLNN